MFYPVLRNRNDFFEANLKYFTRFRQFVIYQFDEFTKDIDYDDDEKDSHDRGADRRRPERWAQQRIRNYAVNNEDDGGRAPLEYR